jgi:hypothetical protein
LNWFYTLTKTWKKVIIRKHVTHGIYWVSFFLKSLAFIQLYQSHSVYLSCHLSQFYCLNNSQLMSYIHCSHSHFQYQHSRLLIPPSIHFIRYTAPFKSFECYFGRDPLPWSWSTGTAVVHWALLSWWCQNMVLCQKPYGTLLFQVICKRHIH